MAGFRLSLAPFFALLVFAVCGGIAWLAHIEAGEMTTDRRPPLVKASTMPLKRSPDDPGGRAVADLGGVGELLSDQPAETEENLLPRPEQPVTPAEGEGGSGEGSERAAGAEARAALEALVSEIRSGKTADENGDVGLGGPNDDEPVQFPSPSRPGSRASTAEPVTPRPASNLESEGLQDGAGSAEEPPSREAEVALATPVFEATSGGRYRVQLAAVREEVDAQRAWAIFQRQLGPFVSGLRPFFERAETSNGVFYRVQIGPFAETAEADRLCAELKKQDASCFVVSR